MRDVDLVHCSRYRMQLKLGFSFFRQYFPTPGKNISKNGVSSSDSESKTNLDILRVPGSDLEHGKKTGSNSKMENLLRLRIFVSDPVFSRIQIRVTQKDRIRQDPDPQHILPTTLHLLRPFRPPATATSRSTEGWQKMTASNRFLPVDRRLTKKTASNPYLPVEQRLTRNDR